jgi:prephenate dehydratase
MDLRNIRVAVPGIAGSFHYSQGLDYFGAGATLIPYPSFRSTCEALSNNSVDYAILAAGNSIAGNIRENYELLEEFKLSIVAETYREIRLHLLARVGAGLDALRHVHSHPMALLQCTTFLGRQKELETVPGSDTAYCARQLAAAGSGSGAVIASAEAAEMYGLEVLVKNIQDRTDNYTRFWILSKGKVSDEGANKATLAFVRSSDHIPVVDSSIPAFLEAGLEISVFQGQSLPGNDAGSKYYADILFTDLLKYKYFLRQLSLSCSHLQVLGEYSSLSMQSNQSKQQ